MKGSLLMTLVSSYTRGLGAYFPKRFPTKPTVLSGCFISITTFPQVDIPRQTMATSKPSASQDVSITAYKSASP